MLSGDLAEVFDKAYDLRLWLNRMLFIRRKLLNAGQNFHFAVEISQYMGFVFFSEAGQEVLGVALLAKSLPMKSLIRTITNSSI